MKCQRCPSERVIQVTGKCSDCCGVYMDDSKMNGYVPDDLGIGGGDYIDFDLCLECGQLQGIFPRKTATIEKDITNKQVAEFFENHFTKGTSIDSIPRKHQHDLINAAVDKSPKFGIFLNEFFEFNSDCQPPEKFPSCEKFVRMYSENKPNLGSDW